MVSAKIWLVHKHKLTYSTLKNGVYDGGYGGLTSNFRQSGQINRLISFPCWDMEKREHNIRLQ